MYEEVIELNIRKYRKLIVFLLDILIIFVVSIFLLYLFPDSNGTDGADFYRLCPNLLLFVTCWIVAQYIFKTYDSLWRYAQSIEYLMLFWGGISSFLIFLIVDFTLINSGISVLFSMAGYSISFIMIILMRMSYRQYRNFVKSKFRKNKIPIAILGAGAAGVKLLEEIEGYPECRYTTMYFIDDSLEKIGKRIHNIEVRGPLNKLDKLLLSAPVNEIIITTPSLPSEIRKFIVETCSYQNCRVRTLPDSMTLLSGSENNLRDNVRDIKIEELLGRSQVTLNHDEMERFLFNKTIMVTGGGGSIGSELCRQIAKARIKKLIIVDIYENNAYEIQQELRQSYGEQLDLKIEIASIRDKEKINQLLERHRPNIIFHAAAHKHVPLMEDCPDEAILNNIFGTYHLVQAAECYGVDKFVLISTDKAVNPTSIMGASKRFCEMILQSMKENSKTGFVAVRFGNVLGSNGSVIPLFQKQIAQGGPVTITDKRIVRYFMTITEAAQLVLQAGAMANNSEVYVLDMGEPVKIIELAENLIRLSGSIPYTEIPIIETGLRPGEKLYEELLMNSNELIATQNHKIFIEQQNNISKKEIDKKLKILSKALKTKSKIKINIAMKKVVPNYKDPDEVNNVIE
jgi:FlaA1/EpsC-like NDP-sugar epimerase